MTRLSTEMVQKWVDLALEEDLGGGDATTLATVPAEAVAEAVMAARQPMVVCGVQLAEAAFQSVSDQVRVERCRKDGEGIGAGDVLLRVSGPAQALLSAERVALNFVQRLSGIATLTAEYVNAVEGTGAEILDTRKTTPGWRVLEKYAVESGGGRNHRFGLYDQILIKDNHLVALRNEEGGALRAAVQRARGRYPQLTVEVEADHLEQVEEALAAGADIILLDNMGLEDLRKAVAMIGRRALSEASGGVTLATVRRIAETGVNRISAGALTHSAPAVDVGLDFSMSQEAEAEAGRA